MRIEGMKISKAIMLKFIASDLPRGFYFNELVNIVPLPIEFIERELKSLIVQGLIIKEKYSDPEFFIPKMEEIDKIVKRLREILTTRSVQQKINI